MREHTRISVKLTHSWQYPGTEAGGMRLKRQPARIGKFHVCLC